MTLKERIARAILAECERQQDDEGLHPYVSGETEFLNEVVLDGTFNLLPIAQAALEAMISEGLVLVSREYVKCLANLYDKHTTHDNDIDRVKWEGVWYEGPLATAYLRTVEEVSKAGKIMLASDHIKAAIAEK